MNKIYIDWIFFNNIMTILIQRLKKDNITYDGVYGIPRGGLIIAVFISHKLKIPLLMAPTDNSLVVDDISDTGLTLQGIKHKKILTIFYTRWSVTKPDYFYGHKSYKTDWIVYPWEDEND